MSLTTTDREPRRRHSPWQAAQGPSGQAVGTTGEEVQAPARRGVDDRQSSTGRQGGARRLD